MQLLPPKGDSLVSTRINWTGSEGLCPGDERAEGAAVPAIELASKLQ